MEKKYSLTNERKTVDEHIVYRIIAEKDFGDIKKGTLGGFVESENNLSHNDNCWIYNNATVFGNAIVRDDAIIYNNVVICENAMVRGNAMVRDNAMAYGKAIIGCNAIVYGNAKVYDNAKIFDNAKVFDYARIFNGASVFDNAKVYDMARIYNNAMIYGNAKVYDEAFVFGTSKVYGDGVVSENMCIDSANVNCSLKNNISENIRCQTGLGVFNGKIIAYKQIKKDMTSFFDKNFKYEVGKVIEVENAEISNRPCASGLHFSNMNYWNNEVGADTGYLMAEIDIKDIITVQQGKIRCKKAKILGTYNI